MPLKVFPVILIKQIDSIKQNDDDVEVHFKDGRSEHYDLVIGADGIHSDNETYGF